jgi:putative ABC transport system permease protein
MLKLALRGLLRSPAFLVSVVITLALAITANVTVMSLLSATVLRKPPVPDPDKVVIAVELTKNNSLAQATVRPSRYLAWRTSPVFEGCAALQSGFATIVWNGGSKRISVDKVTSSFFKVLGTLPALGATFSSDNAESPGIVLSHRLWVQEFGADRGIIGRTLSSEGLPYTVIGVMPPDFRIPSQDPEAWIRIPDDEWKGASPTAAPLRVLARLAPGINAVQAEQALTAISRSLPPETGQQEVRPVVMSLQEYIIEAASVKPVVSVLMGAMILVLLIACVNVSHLLFVRMSAKTPDLAVQLSLGAAKTHLLRGVVYEAVIIAVASEVIGLFLSLWSTQALQSRLTFNDYVAALQLRLDGSTMWFSVGIVLLLVILLSTIPALFLRTLHTNAILHETGRGMLTSRRRSRTGAALVIMQAVSSSVLLILTSAMVVKFIVAKEAPVGFDSTGLVIARLSLEHNVFEDSPRRSQFIQTLLERLHSQPGVQSVAAADSLPMLGGGSVEMDAGEGRQWRSVKSRAVSPGFFATLKIPMLRGTDFPERTGDSDRLVIVSEVFAERFLGSHPLDQRVRLRENANSPVYPYRVVGVVGNTKHWFGEPGEVPDVYRPYSEAPSSDATVVMRSSLDPSTLAPLIRSVVQALEASQPVGTVSTYRSALEFQEADEVVLITILGFIAALALILASLGIYGVLGYTIQMRHREFGLRLALGSTPNGLTRHVLKTSALLMGTGVGIGLLLTPLLIQMLNSVFRGKVTHVGTIVLIVFVVELFSILLATWIPARQASRVDPIELLRSA